MVTYYKNILIATLIAFGFLFSGMSYAGTTKWSPPAGFKKDGENYKAGISVSGDMSGSITCTFKNGRIDGACSILKNVNPGKQTTITYDMPNGIVTYTFEQNVVILNVNSATDKKDYGDQCHLDNQNNLVCDTARAK